MAKESESGSGSRKAESNNAVTKAVTNKTVPDQNSKSSSGSSVLASLSFVVALGAVGTSFWLSQQSDQKVNELESALSQFKQQINVSVNDKLKEADVKIENAAQGFSTQQAKFKTDFNDAMVASSKQQSLLEEEVQHLSDATSAIGSRVGIQSTTWIIAEAEYLLTLANHRVSLDKDVKTAIAALQAADQRLKQVGDPALLNVRRQISDEINALRSVDIPDIAGMALELASLAATAEDLPLIIKQREPTLASAFSSTGEATSNIENATGIMNAVWKDIKSLVVIRKNDRPIDVLMAPDQRHFLFQNLILKIETGRLALLRNEPANLKISLDVAHKWLQAYFDQDTAAYANFVATMERIQLAKLTTVYPDITKSVNILREYKDRKAHEAVDAVSKAAPKKSKKKVKKVAKISIPTSKQKSAPVKVEAPVVKEEMAKETTKETTAEPESVAKIQVDIPSIDKAQPERDVSAADKPEIQQAAVDTVDATDTATTTENSSELDSSKDGAQ